LFAPEQVKVPFPLTIDNFELLLLFQDSSPRRLFYIRSFGLFF
jgi:hypothetical protein